MSNMVNIEIDGKLLQAPQGSMIIEAADNANIYIPRFCYHKKLSIAANCRMCLVEVDKSKKPLPACATPVTEGMRIFTHSPMALESQRTVMEFLLANHPLDCPICDQGGECELQDLSIGYGRDNSFFTEGKRSVDDVDIGPLVSTNMTRCIHCTRCIRFGHEIAGVRELGLTHRGEHAEVTTYIEHSLTSELSGNVIDLCPVGALTSRPYRYQARAWELKQASAISPHDGIGSHVSIHSRRQQVLRVLPRAAEAINENWLSDRDRYSYLGLYEQRLTQAFIKQQNGMQPVAWSEAFQFIQKRLNAILISGQMNQVAAYLSPSTSLEEMFLLQSIVRGFDSTCFESRIRQKDKQSTIFSGLPITLADIEEQDTFFVIGSHLVHEQPILGVRVRKAVQNGARVFSLNSLFYDFHFPQEKQLVVPPSQYIQELLGIIKALKQQGLMIPVAMDKELEQIQISESQQQIAVALADKQTSRLLVIGQIAQQYSHYSIVYQLTKIISELTEARIAILPYGSNAIGAELLSFAAKSMENDASSDSFVKHDDLHGAFAKVNSPKVIFLYNFEPDLDVFDSEAFIAELQEADIVIAFSAFESQFLQKIAHVILPITPFTENSGTWINIEKKWQFVDAAVPALGEARPGWKVLRVLGNYLNLKNFDYTSIEMITEQIKSQLAKFDFSQKHQAFSEQDCQKITDLLKVNSANDTGFERVSEWPMYRVDSLVRRSKPLQETPINFSPAIYLNEQQIKALGLQENEIVSVASIQGKTSLLPVKSASFVPVNVVFIPASYEITSSLGDINHPVTIRKQIS